MQDDYASQWVGLTAAAARVGVAVDTMRRRAKRGDVPSRQVPTPQGHRWEVLLSEPAAAQPSRETALAEEVHELHRRIAQLTEENRALVEQVGFLKGQVQQLRE